MSDADVIANIVIIVCALGLIAACVVASDTIVAYLRGNAEKPPWLSSMLDFDEDEDEYEDDDEPVMARTVRAVAATAGVPIRLVSTERTAQIERTNANERLPDAVRSHKEYDRLKELEHNMDGVIEILLRLGWTATQIRDHVKGTAADLSTRIRTVRERIEKNAPPEVAETVAAADPPRMLKIRDNGAPERLIPL